MKFVPNFMLDEDIFDRILFPFSNIRPQIDLYL